MSGRMRIGIDLGGTKTEGVLLGDSATEPIARLRVPTPRSGGYEGILDQILELIRLLEAGAAGFLPPVGVGIPGVVSASHGRVKNANTTELIGRPLRTDIESRLGRSVVVENDANCFALAEALHGAGAGSRCVFGVILGTGVGGGISLDGAVWSGAQGIAGEWGHNMLEQDGPPCYCGRKGCVETFLSGPGLVQEYRRLAPAASPSIDAGAVWERSSAGDRAAAEAVERYKERFGRAIAVVVNILDPDVVVLGGGVSKAPGLAEEAIDRIRPHLFNDEIRTQVRRHQLGDSAGVLGAAFLSSHSP